MATTPSARITSTSTTDSSALTPEVRRKLKSTVLELRHLLEDDFRRQLGAVAVTEDGVKSLAAGRALSDEQQRVRDTAVAMLKREVAGGASQTDAFTTLLRESVFTFLNRAIGLRCMEARGLLLVDGQTETAITQQDELGGISSLYWRVRNTPSAPAQPREIWRETYRRACVAVSRDIRVLFDPQAEYAALFPLQPTMQRVVEALNDPAIPPAAYTEDAVLGWVYQYFQSEEKDRIFAEVRSKKKKIGGADIIPVTQLYTEQYMVDFLLQNSLGRTWMEMYPDSPAKAAWPYYVEPATPHARPRKPLRDWAILDPCVGSGHFLVVAFDLLVPLYAEERRMGESGAIPLEETVAPADAPLTILERNLYGIDIDRRATQIATLALYLKAREAGLARSPRVGIVAADASFLQGEAWERFLAGFEREPSVRRVLAAMAGYLKDIRELGSLLRPEEELKRLIAEEHKRWEDAGRPQQAGLFVEYETPRQERLAFEQVSDETFWEQLSYRAEAAIQGFYDSARASGDLDEQIVAGEAQRGFTFLEMCQRRYDVVCTNPPYMGTRTMGAGLKIFISKHYAAGKHDLYAAFVLRCLELVHTDAHLGMVTQQSWMFLQTFADLRALDDLQQRRAPDAFPGLLRATCIDTLVHLGPGAFSEISGEIVNIALFTLRRSEVTPIHQLTSFRLIGPRGVREKAAELQKAAKQSGNTITMTSTQISYLKVPDAPLMYWLSPMFFELLSSGARLASIAEVKHGIVTSDNDRFVRWHWEVHLLTAWQVFAKGGSYKKWVGSEYFVINWANSREHIAQAFVGRVRDASFFGRRGWTYALVATGRMSARRLRSDWLYDNGAPTVFSAGHWEVVGAYLNTHTASYLLRLLSQSIRFNGYYVEKLPLIPQNESLATATELCIQLKQKQVRTDNTEYSFRASLVYDARQTQVASAVSLSSQIADGELAILHSAEGWSESLVAAELGLQSVDMATIFDETGTPAAYYPLLAGYDALPTLPADLPSVPQELLDYLATHQRLTLAPEALARLKDRLRTLYIAGPGAKVEEVAEEKAGDGEGDEGGDEEQEGAVALGARIPIPAETFLEELSQRLEVHPISVYWLLEEMRRDEGLVCPPEMKRQMEDYASVTLLRELGFRWPEQDAYEAEHGLILDPALVVEDGILPLVDCGAGATAAQQLRLRLERDFGEEGADESEAEFRKWVGRPLDDWLRRDCFKRHIQQFKQRPIAWHFVSPGKTFEAFVLYHKLCDEAIGRETLQRLRTQYAGGLIARLRGEQDRARMSRDDREVTRLQLAIEDVEEFRERLERLERADELKARIRCRWKGDEAREGRPGPYAPDINDGVKVNVRPFQELGLLAAVVIKKWE
ncbi:MAG TPA: BREX-1 system adenine-specific DNA-methyltransferase PglX [Ktedonobacterales bacterium]|jgi:molybdopterin-guanine dinucleotide biosynthesis protein A|nr:BREX-1 system adenine-specific DNA-methyltransferase PglX [Ktedonobacterales bacterium]